MVKQMFGKKVIAAMVISAMLTPCFAVMADDDSDLQNQLSDVQSQMDQQVQKKNEAAAVIGSVLEKSLKSLAPITTSK